MSSFKHSLMALAMLQLAVCSCNPTADPDNNEGGTTDPVVIQVQSISIEPSSHKLTVDETVQLKATVLPSDATDKDITWSVDPVSVASVSNSGLVKAIANGTAKVTAKAGGKDATCYITVEDKPQASIQVTDVRIEPTVLTLHVDEKASLSATVVPVEAMSGLSWDSKNPAVATVENGTVTAIGTGETDIVASAGGLTASCRLTVLAKLVQVESVIVTPSSLSLSRGETRTLSAAILPENASDQEIKWESENPLIANVDRNGKVTAVGPDPKTGTRVTSIYATAGGKSGSCTVTVVVPVTSLTLNCTQTTMYAGGYYTLTASILPEDATDKTITWRSSSPSIASVTNGRISAIAEGTATISASAGNQTAECTVTVIGSSNGGHEGTGDEDWK